MLTRIKITLGKLFLASLERHGLTVVQIGSPRLKTGDWFSIKKIIRCPQDGSYRGDLFRADRIEGAFVACTGFSRYGGSQSKHSFHIPDFEVQTLTPDYVRAMRPELNAVTR